MATVKLYRHTDTNAPQLAGVVGRMITLLDAVLVNGYNTVNVASITRDSSIATVTTASVHGFNTGDIILIAGANQTPYNAEFRVTVTSTTTFTFAVTSEPASPATGTITCKRAPAGFSKAFAGTSKGVYRSNDLSSDRRFYRFTDDGTTTAGASEIAVTGWENMTSVDAGDGRFPNTADDANGHYMRKSSTNDATNRPWTIVSDGKTVYMFVEYTGNAANVMGSSVIHTMAFGDTRPLRPTDKYCSFIAGSTSANNTITVTNGFFNAASTFTTPAYNSFINVNRDINGVTLGVPHRQVGCTASNLGSSAYIRYPNGADNSLIIGPVALAYSEMLRAFMPGIYDNYHGRVIANGDFIDNVRGYEGRKFMMQYGQSGTTACCVFIDITGPWE
ncbi:hypothetical protein [Acinetobacter parvus]|uniref:hypothetical protein n=1 Tax=Acinetobacter parvus TaxID=134533 RepID=UPI0021CFDD49|nr:hypothetical protein [Acinetobacter parvus]MCU4393392.1 hypothetical protein [Acinetobacter parvus]